ncbi:unnamed protein product [Urochloa decumbens]|uniref:Uncharacterized protein n=1 Tax=Urochloa decumbens TaxID=240449 RepID=A0ABC9CE28_9POAL
MSYRRGKKKQAPRRRGSICPRARSTDPANPSIRSYQVKGRKPDQVRSDSGGRGTGGLGLEVPADPLDDLPPLGAVLQEPLGASGLDLLGDGGEGRERAAADRGLLPELRPLVGTVRVGPVGGALLDLDEAPEADVAHDDVHGAALGVDERGLDAVAERGAVGGGRRRREEAAEDEGERRGPHRDGARRVEAARVGVEAAVEGVDVGDVGERRVGRRVRELAPRRRRHAVPRVPVDVLLRVHHHGAGVLA